MNNKYGIVKLWKKTTPPKILLFSGVFFSIFNTVVSLIIPLILKKQIETIENGFSYGEIIGIILLIILELLTMGISIYILATVGQKIVLNLRERLWKKILKLDIDFHNKNQSGELVSRVTNDTLATMNLLSSEFAELLSGILSIVGSIIILFFLDVPMTLVLLLSIPITIFIIMPISKKLNRVSYINQERMSNLSGFLAKVLSEIRLVKAYNTEEIECSRGRKYLIDLYNNSLSRAKIEAFLLPLLSGVVSIMILGIVGFGAYRVSNGFISSGELMAFMLYLFQIVTPIGAIGRFINNINSSSGATQRIFEIIEEKEEKYGEYQPKNLNTSFQSLEIKNLTFRYKESPVLKNISIQIYPNSTTAIVGPSGSGKSTLFYLLERFYTPNSGEILLDNKSHLNVELNEWRNMFSYVSQDAQIIAGTIKENILYGVKKKIDNNVLVKACTQANCHEFIMKLPNGYDTKIQEKGVNLSGGQKQRIAIARALLRDSPILLLDEATANLDSESERNIKSSLDKLSINKTIIVIAHRISTIKNADQIIVLNNGHINGVGTHKQLLINNNVYRSLANEQLKKIT